MALGLRQAKVDRKKKPARSWLLFLTSVFNINSIEDMNSVDNVNNINGIDNEAINPMHDATSCQYGCLQVQYQPLLIARVFHQLEQSFYYSLYQHAQ